MSPNPFSEPSPVASAIGTPISSHAPTFHPPAHPHQQQLQQSSMPMAHPPTHHQTRHQPSLPASSSGVSNYEILEYLIRIDERLKSMSNRLTNMEVTVQRVVPPTFFSSIKHAETTIKTRPQSVPDEHEYSLNRTASSRSTATLQTNCARTLLSLAGPQRSSEPTATDSGMPSPVSSKIQKEPSASSSLSAAITTSSSGSNESAVVEPTAEAQSRKRMRSCQPATLLDDQKSDSLGGINGTPMNVTSWMKVTQKILCENELFPPDANVTFSESSKIVFGEPNAYLTRMSAKSLQTVMTTFRAKLKKAIMDNLDYIVDLKDGENLDAVCKVVLRGNSYVHDGDKMYQSPTLAKGLCLMFQFDEDLVSKWNWESYPLTCLAFGIISLKFCLEHPSTDGHRVPNRNGQQMYEQALTALKEFIAADSAAFDKANNFLFEYGKREAKRLKEVILPAKALMQQRSIVSDRVTRPRPVIENSSATSSTNGYGEEYEYESQQAIIDEEDYFAPNDSYPTSHPSLARMEYIYDEETDDDGELTGEDEDFVPGVEKDINSASGGGRKKRRKGRKPIAYEQSSSGTPIPLPSLNGFVTGNGTSNGNIVLNGNGPVVDRVGGRQPSSAIAHFWMLLHRWAAENNMFFIDQRVIEDACETAFGNRERYLENSPRSIDANFSTWRGAMKRFMLEHLDDVVGLQPGQDLGQRCAAMLSSNRYLHDGDKLYQSEVLARAFFHILYDEGLEFSSKKWNWSTIPIAALAFTMSILKFCLQNPGASNTVHRKGRDKYLEFARDLEEYRAHHPAEFEQARCTLWMYVKRYGDGRSFRTKNVRTS
ncbi:hypothetical protein SeMB42_g03344 [Synchytrium endobioticum]|uniref:DUF6532 domain-containing protein n=1 Tax=Synchytrium endobioticum TaxID=286115 RepID=A0A507D7Y9_9FUNG|nr:hypothetical protein SeMB42_g03344 [Synchytrium endobioticum]TPX48686.1 hypothetical protein SeLEV6574_g01902 [Synchytrium endobioticum]